MSRRLGYYNYQLKAILVKCNLRGVFEKKQNCANKYFITNENSKLQHVLFNQSSLLGPGCTFAFSSSMHSWNNFSRIALSSFVNPENGFLSILP